MMAVARPQSLVLDSRVEADASLEVAWYFQLAEAEMSCPSNFGRMLSSIAPDGRWRTPEDQADAAGAHARIRRWLYAMPNHEAGVLQVAFEPRDLPRPVTVRFGALAAVAVRLTCTLTEWPEDREAQRRLDCVRASALAERCRQGLAERAYLERLEARAKARLDKALGEYVRVRGKGRCVLPPRARREV